MSVEALSGCHPFRALLVSVLLGLSCGAQAQEVEVAKAEREALLEVGVVQAQAVTAFNEALMTAQAVGRARAYLAGWEWSGRFRPLRAFPADLKALDRQLQVLEDRFSHLYQAHFGTPAAQRPGEREKEVVTLSAAAQRLPADAAARAAELAAAADLLQIPHSHPPLNLH